MALQKLVYRGINKRPVLIQYWSFLVKYNIIMNYGDYMIPFARISKYGNIVIATNIKDIQASIDSNCAILSTDNKLYMRGYNDNYNFGIPNNKTNNYLTWTYVRDDVEKMFIGAVLSIIFTTDNKIMATGKKNALGTGSDLYNGYTDVTALFAASGLTIDNIKEIHIGQWSVLALRDDGNLYGVGANGWFELGITGAVTTFRLMASAVDTCYLNTGSSFYMKNNVLYACGRNSVGLLGVGKTDSYISAFAACVGLPTGNYELTSINENGSGTSIVLTDSAGLSKAYVTGGGLGVSNRNTFTEITFGSSVVRPDAWVTSGAPSVGNFCKTNDILYGLGTSVGLPVTAGSWRDTLFGSTDNITHVVSLRSYGTYVLSGTTLYAVESSSTWFGATTPGWVEQQSPT